MSAAMGAPTLRNTMSKRSLINVTPVPASGFAPPGKDEMIVTFIPPPPVDSVVEGVVAVGAEVVVAFGAAGAGDDVATELVDPAPVFGRNMSTSHVSMCGANVTLLPFIPVTRRPLMVVLPAPRRELSGCTARVNGLTEFLTWISSALDVFRQCRAGEHG